MTPQLLTSLARAVRLGVSATARETKALFEAFQVMAQDRDQWKRDAFACALLFGTMHGRLERENAQLRAKVDELTDALTIERATRQLDEMAVAA
jgi:hypothetical protein